MLNNNNNNRAYSCSSFQSSYFSINSIIYLTTILLLIINQSASFHIVTYPQNKTIENNKPYPIYFQPGFCSQQTDKCQVNEKFQITVFADQQCSPQQSLTFDIDCPLKGTCTYPSKNLNCSQNNFTGVNQTKTFSAIIGMKSSTNTSHSIETSDYVISVTWEYRKPEPDPQNNGDLDWLIYVGVSVGLVLLLAGAVFLVKRCQKKQRDQNYDKLTS